MLLHYLGIPYWGALVLAPIIVGATGIVIERLFISRLYHLDHLYGLLLTFGLALIIEGLFRQQYGSSGLPYANPIPGGTNLGFMFLPWYRGLGHRLLAGRVPRHLVHDREDASSAPICAPPPSGPTWCRRSASTCRA